MLPSLRLLLYRISPGCREDGADLLLCVLSVDRSQLLLWLSCRLHRTVPAARLGSSVAQLSVVPVRWTNTQEVSYLDTYTAPGSFQKAVGVHAFAR